MNLVRFVLLKLFVFVCGFVDHRLAFVNCLLAFVLSLLLRFTTSQYTFGIFNHFFLA